MYFNRLKSGGYFMYQQVSHSRILYGALIVFMCAWRISKQTATFTLYSINRLVLYHEDGQCLLGNMSLYIKQKHLAIKWLNYKPKSKSKVNL